MRPLLTLLLVFVVLDVLSLFWAAKIIGGLAVFGLLLLAFVAGSSLLGGGRLSRIMLLGGMLGGGTSLYRMLLPLRIPLAGLLFLMPGFLSDIVALFLLLPLGGGQSAGAAGQSGFDSNRFSQGGFSQSAPFERGVSDGDIIEGEFVVRDKNSKQP